MTNDTRTADDIERDIDEERARMSGTINDLQKKFSVEGIVTDLGAMFRGQGGDLGRSVTEVLGRNPAALTMVGVGLAWLFLGQAKESATDAPRYDRDRAYGGNWDRAMPKGRHRPARSQDGDTSWFNESVRSGNGYTDWQGDGSERMNGAAETSSAVMGSIRNGADAVVDAVSNAAGSVRDTAVHLTERLSSGTEGFSEDAKARVVTARRMAHDAANAAQAAVSGGGNRVSNLFEDQPLVMGALAVAMGAAIGSVLPHSQIEDDTLGANRDRMFADAQRVFNEERAKAMAVIKAAATEAEGALKDTGSELAAFLPDGKSAGDVIVDHISGAAARVSDTAKDEAARQGFMGERQS